MLASILPGLRDLRVPLATGYIWLTALWLFFGAKVPPKAEATGPLTGLYDVLDLTGPTTVLAISSFVAYLIGAVTSVKRLPWLTAAAHEFVPSMRLRQAMRFSETRKLIRQSPAMRLFAQARNAGRLEEVIGPDINAHFENAYQSSLPSLMAESKGGIDRETIVQTQLTETFDLIAQEQMAEEQAAYVVSLQLETPQLFDAHDRLSAESSFAFSTAIALTGLIVSAAKAFDQWWLLVVLVIVPVLLWRGLRLEDEASEIIHRALIVGQIKSPFLGLVESIKPGAF